MEIVRDLAAICSEITVIAGAIALLIKPIRQRVFDTIRTHNGLKCLLRSEMMHTYYAHREERQIRQYAFENFIACYEAYKALNGNSFIDHIYEEMKDWEIIT